MLVFILKWWVRLGLPFFTKTVLFSGKERLSEKGPLVLAVNHPNSFLDAILLGAFMNNPVHYLARGDVFRIGWVRKLFTNMNMLPIYRIRDGKDKLGLNDQTFELSRKVLSDNGILLVFVEGFCEHQTTLQLPLKKGAPRVIETCWALGIPVRILPIWLNYSSFTAYPKVIEIKLGEVFGKPKGMEKLEPALAWQKINEQTAEALAILGNAPKKQTYLSSPLLRVVLTIPALLGAVLHAPLYLPVKTLVGKATRTNVHFDSALFGVLLVTYPLFLIIIGILMGISISGLWFFFPFFMLPLLARCYVIWK